TNAAKYGALSTAEGRVMVDWSVSDDGVFHLVWREVGGPPVRPPTREGFGTRLLQQGLAAELNGKVEIDYKPDGMTCTVTLPAAALA
ncbi:MAG: sensor histidine kinase, partial [Alphaproteobacteria bacterium]|nr:sensor histidine kinase [Alphaproteobacteria bacterium]